MVRASVPGGALERDAVAGHRPAGRHRRRRHLPVDLARRDPAPLRPQGGSGAAHPQPRRAPRHHAGRLRRRRAQHRRLPGTPGRQSPEGAARSRPAAGRAVPPPHAGVLRGLDRRRARLVGRRGGAGHRPGTALRHHVPPSQVQDRPGVARRWLHRHLQPRPRPRPDHRHRRRRRVRGAGRWRARRHPRPARRHLPASGRPPRMGPGRGRRGSGRGRRPGLSRPGRPGGSQAGAAEVRAGGHRRRRLPPRGRGPPRRSPGPCSCIAALAGPRPPGMARSGRRAVVPRRAGAQWARDGSVARRAGRGGRAAPDRPAGHPSPGCPAHRHRRRRAHGRRSCLPSSRRCAGGRPRPGAPLGHGLPRPPHLWAGLGRGGTGRAGGAERGGGRAGPPGAVRSRPARADDRMSQRLRPSVHGGDRDRRAQQDRLRRSPRWRSGRRSAGPAGPRGVKLADLPSVLGPWFDRFATEREPGESFGDFVHRTGSLA